MPRSSIIAIVCDFDDTLGEDTTNLFLRNMLGMSASKIRFFWDTTVGKRVRDGWDPPLAYMTLILRELRKKNLAVTNEDLRELGGSVVLFPGVQDLVPRLRAFVRRRKFKEANVSVEFYIISGGFEEIIKGTPIAPEIERHRIFGCTFHATPKGGVVAPKSIVTFTEKTKFLYAINKGVFAYLKRNPYAVNDVMPDASRRIPFENMIYIGDGPTDIPCFSSVQRAGGKTIGILKYNKLGGHVTVDKTRAWAIAKGERATLGPFNPDYQRGSDLYRNLEMQIERIGLDIWDSHYRREP